MKVSVICVADRPDRLPCLYWSLVAQTHKDWEMIVLDQGGGHCLKNLPANEVMRGDRLKYYQVHNYKDWGQTAKEQAATSRRLVRGDALMFPADDVYYVPVALEWMSAQLESGYDVSICGWLYDIFNYAAMPPSTAQGWVDIGGIMMKREAFLKVGWRDKSQIGDHTLLIDMATSGASLVTIPNILYVKN